MKRSLVTLALVVSLLVAGCGGTAQDAPVEVTPVPLATDGADGTDTQESSAETPTEPHRPRRTTDLGRTRDGTASGRSDEPSTTTPNETGTPVQTTVSADRRPTATTTPTESIATADRIDLPPGVSERGVTDPYDLTFAHQRTADDGGVRLEQSRVDCRRCEPDVTTVDVGDDSALLASPYHDIWATAGERTVVHYDRTRVPYQFGDGQLNDRQRTMSHDVAETVLAFDFEVTNTTTRNGTTTTTLRSSNLTNPDELLPRRHGAVVDGNATLVVDESGLVTRYSWTIRTEADDETDQTLSETLTVNHVDGVTEPEWVETARERAIDLDAHLVTNDGIEYVRLDHVGGDTIPANSRVELYSPGEERVRAQFDRAVGSETVYLVYRDSELVVADQPPSAETSDPLPFTGGTVLVSSEGPIVASTTF